MGKIMLNEIDYSGGNANVIRLTQAEYDALPPSKLTDNNVYMITDVNGDGSQFQPVIYSEDEREIGVWTDGKPLYEKTIIFDNAIIVYYNQWATTTVEQNNIDLIVKLEALDNSGFAVSGLMTKFSNNLMCLNSYTSNGVSIKTVIIYYTKTTDTAGSGTWTPQGVPAVHYSTDEKVVGTWIDGKSLYEKTIDFGALPNTATKNVAHNIASIDKIWVYDGYIYGNIGQAFQLNRPTNAFNYQWETTVDRTNVSIQDFANFGNDFSAFVVVRYTKTSQGGN